MFVLSRKMGQAIALRCTDGAEVVVYVVKKSGQNVVLGGDAPDDVEIVREELLVVQSEEDGDDINQNTLSRHVGMRLR